MRILRESYTLNEIQDRITDTRNILSALRDSLYILSSALENPDEQREEYEDLAYNVDKYYIGDIESMIGDFERDSKGVEELEESVKGKRNKRVNEGMLRTIDFGTIKIVPRSKITKFDKFIKNDLADEYCYYQTTDGEVVAVENENLEEDTIKTKDGKWVNKGDTGETHGEFKTKKEADAQRRAMFANGYKG